MRTPRALLVWLGIAALFICALQGVTGADQLAIYAGPLLLVVGLLLSGRFIGEDAILARRGRLVAVVPRPPRRRWSPVREYALTSRLERSTRRLRGPPAVAPAAA